MTGAATRVVRQLVDKAETEAAEKRAECFARHDAGAALSRAQRRRMLQAPHTRAKARGRRRDRQITPAPAATGSQRKNRLSAISSPGRDQRAHADRRTRPDRGQQPAPGQARARQALIRPPPSRPRAPFKRPQPLLAAPLSGVPAVTLFFQPFHATRRTNLRKPPAL